MKNNWPIKKLGEVVVFLDSKRKPVTKKDRNPGPYPYYGANGQQDSVADYIFDEELVLLAEDGGNFGSKSRPVAYRISGKSWVNNHAHVLRAKKEYVDIDFLGYTLMFYDVTPYITGSTRGKLNKSDASRIPISIPPLEIQKKIVERLDAIKKAQDLNSLQLSKTDELFESILSKMFSEKASAVELGSVCKFVGGGTPSKSKKEYFVGDIPWITVKDIPPSEIYDSQDHVNEEAIKNSAANLVPENTVLVVTRVGLGKIGITRIPCCFNQDIKALMPTVEIDPNYLYFAMVNAKENIIGQGAGATVKGITLSTLGDIKIPVPPLSEQQKIVAKLNAIQDYKKLLLKQKDLLQELFDSVLYKSMNGGT